MSNPTVLSDAEVKEAMQCLVAEVESDGETVVIKNVNQCLRNIEQALLQSPEIQQLRKDAERYRFIRDKKQVTEAWDNDGAYLMTRPLCRLKFSYFPKEIREKYKSDDLLGSAIDAAMEVKP